MEFVDDLLYEFDGQLSVSEIKQMTYKEIGYLREHRKKTHPREADILAKGLMGQVSSKK
jgi:hypothetical protein